MFEIRYDNDKIKKLERELRNFGKNALPKVMSRALNRTATGARTATSRMLSKEIGLKVGDVRKKLVLIRASYRRWRSAITISRKRIPLIRFGARQTKKGVTYKKQRKRILIRHAFITTMASGHTGVFKRKFSRRLPISELRGPSLGQVYTGAADQASRIHRESMVRLEKNIHDQVQLILKRRLPA
jgi:hypothetical protein